MEGWHRISALGGAGALGIWRGSLPVLSARFLDTGRRARCRSAVEDGAGRVLLDGAHTCRSGHVPGRPRVVPARGRFVCGRVLCAESLSLADRLLAERIRRTSGRRSAAASAALSLAAQGAWLSPHAVVESHAGGSVADEPARSSDDPLLSGWPGNFVGRAEAIMASAVANGARHRVRRRPGLVLSASGYPRTGMDQPQRGTVTRRAAATQFYFHYHRRFRSQPLQSSVFDHTACRNQRPGFHDLVFPPDEARRGGH